MTKEDPQHGYNLLVSSYGRFEITMTHSPPRYESAFGSPLSRALGIGYVQELVARLTKTRIERHNSSTNSTLDDNPVTFPLDHSLYVDATHEVVVLYSMFDVFTQSLSTLSNFCYSNHCSQPHKFCGERAVAHRPHSGAQVFPRV